MRNVEARREYYEFVEEAKRKDRKKLPKSDPDYVYYEYHHVLPRTMFPLWVDRTSNVVVLTAKEHCLAHVMLCKVFHNFQTCFALRRMRKVHTDGLSTEERE